MGQKVVLTCDLHRGATEAAETLRFSVGSNSYELELCATHVKEFATKLDPFIKGARKVGGTRRAATGTRKSTPVARKSGGRRAAKASSTDLGAVRAWARSNGFEVSDRGRVASAIIDAYHAHSAA